jgi:FXSXX-COOH protein
LDCAGRYGDLLFGLADVSAGLLARVMLKRRRGTEPDGGWRMKDDFSDREPGLIDLTGVDLATLAELPDTVLAGSLRRVLTEAEEPADRYAGFQSVSA